MKKMSIEAVLTRFWFSFVENVYDFLFCHIFLLFPDYILFEGNAFGGYDEKNDYSNFNGRLLHWICICG